MLYMAAGQSPELDFVAVRDLREIEQGLRQNHDVRVVVQINRNWPRGAQRYVIDDGGTRSERPLDDITDMGRRETLEQFLTWVAGEPQYEATYYGLILWGHAYGLGFGRDHNDGLMLAEIRQAVQAFRPARRAEARTPLDLLGTNACSMSYLEAAYEFRESAQVMVASQITMPFAGWPYEAILTRLREEHALYGSSPEALAKNIVDAYVHQFDDLPDGDKLAMTALRLSAAEGLDGLVDAVATAIAGEIRRREPRTDTLGLFRDIFMGAAAGDVRPLIDVKKLCDGIDSAESTNTPLRQAATTLRDAVTAMIVKTDRAPELDDLNGVGIYAPFVSDRRMLIQLGLNDADPDDETLRPGAVTGREVYKALALFNDRQAWPTLVFDGLKRTVPRDLRIAIDGIAEMADGDRADVAQIIMAIDSALNRFDREVNAASKMMREQLESDEALQVNEQPIDTPAFFNASCGVFTTVAAVAEPHARALRGPARRTFGLPSLKLVPDAATTEKGMPLPRSLSGSGSRPIVGHTIDRLARVECALAEAERATRRGFLHARFGLGPLNAGGLNSPETGKSGQGLEALLAGFEPGKSGGGLEPGKSGGGLPISDLFGKSGDLRIDLALTRVSGLFREVGTAFGQLEDALAQLEGTARDTLAPGGLENGFPIDPHLTQARLDRAFDLLREASIDARQTVRRVLAHPVYGLGPAETPLPPGTREQLARDGRLDKRHLKLL
jgi:hypothetical protein